MSASPLQIQLQSVKRRWFIHGTTAGLIGATIVAILLLLLGGWLDLVWELSPEGRIGVLISSALLGGTFFIAALVRIGQNVRFSSLARRVDQAMGFGGSVLTGYELEQTFRSKSDKTAALAHIAVEHAAQLAATTIPARAVPAKRIQQSTLVLMSVLGFVGLLTLLLPDMMQTQWNRFAHPYGDVPRFSNTIIEIEDPEKRVLYGEPLDIRAAVRGESVDSATLVLETADGNVETLPMFPEADSFWRTSLAKMTEDAVYYVRTDHARSTRHGIEVIMIPRIENVRFRITPPAYTNRSAYEGPLSKEGLSGLSGTKVEVWATSNRPLSHGEIVLTSGQDESGTSISMFPKTLGDSEVSGEFTITGNGKFELRLFDIDEQGSRDKFSGGIMLLKDERPMIRIAKPPVRSLATPTIILPIVIDAEDDYGISEIQIYRSLNDSRFTASSLPLPDVPPRRFHGQVELPLSTYDLKPGDSIKVFARVEDNDPDGAKGAESAVVVIDIISQTQFEQMLRAKNGLEMMLSRYREALRRLEAAKEELERLQQKLDSLDPNEPASEETKQELKKLAQRMSKEAEAIRKLAQNPLPYELDQQFVEEMDKAAKLAEETAQSLAKMAENPPNNESIKKQLGELSEKLGVGKKSFDQATTPSLELLATVMPLKRAENQFVQLVQRQKDLAERLASLKEREREEDPAVKARMRELEEEQRQIQESLNTLLDDIEEQAKLLPAQEEFDQLRSTALDFADAVRQSEASPAMSAAQSGLAEYSGKIGHAQAVRAAEILEQFLSQCNGMGECAGQCFKFSPGMSNCLSQTLDQLLRDMGFGSNTGNGMMGAGQGLGAQRGGPNVGLYGMLPGMASFAEQGGGQGGSPMYGGGGSGGGVNPDVENGYEMSAEGTVGGTGAGAVPLRYRQAVGRYFQRIIEEGEK